MDDQKLNLDKVTVVITAPVAVLEYLQESAVDEVAFWMDKTPDNESFPEETRAAMLKGYKCTVGQIEDQLPKVRRVIVTVEGGNARVTSCPDDIRVEIVDLDNQEAEKDQDLVEDEGIACCICGCADVDVVQVNCMEHEEPHTGHWPLEVDGFAWDDGNHRNGSTEDEIAECTRCGHRGPLSDFGFGGHHDCD